MQNKKELNWNDNDEERVKKAICKAEKLLGKSRYE